MSVDFKTFQVLFDWGLWLVDLSCIARPIWRACIHTQVRLFSERRVIINLSLQCLLAADAAAVRSWLPDASIARILLRSTSSRDAAGARGAVTGESTTNGTTGVDDCVREVSGQALDAGALTGAILDSATWFSPSATSSFASVSFCVVSLHFCCIALSPLGPESDAAESCFVEQFEGASCSAWTRDAGKTLAKKLASNCAAEGSSSGPSSRRRFSVRDDNRSSCTNTLRSARRTSLACRSNSDGSGSANL